MHVCVNKCFHVCLLACMYTCTYTCLCVYVCQKLRTHSHRFNIFVVKKKSRHQFTLGFRRHERNTCRQSVGGSLLKHLVGLMLEGEVNSIGQSRCNLTKTVLVLSWLMSLELTRQMRWLGYRLLLLVRTSPLGISILRRHTLSTLQYAHCTDKLGWIPHEVWCLRLYTKFNLHI